MRRHASVLVLYSLASLLALERQSGLASSATPGIGTPAFVRWHPSGGALLVREGVIQVRQGSGPGSLRSDLPSAGGDWSPAGAQLIVSELAGGERGPQELWRYAWDGSRPRNRRKLVGRGFAHACIAPAWEPEGKRIAFLATRKADGSQEFMLCVTASSGGPPTVLIQGGLDLSPPTWVGDRDLVAVSVLPTGPASPPAPRLALADVSTRAVRRILLPGLPADGTLHVTASADQGSLIFGVEGERAASGSVGQFGLDSSKTTWLTVPEWRGAEGLYYPRLSPDGAYLACIVARGPIRELSLQERRTGLTRTVLRGPDLYGPAWSPDGRSIAVWQDDVFAGKGRTRLLLLKASGHRVHSVSTLMTSTHQ
jgi:dipeptidyl aminopeptidase/acylaminoacyl peptidase